jgi:hypothetical protein
VHIRGQRHDDGSVRFSWISWGRVEADDCIAWTFRSTEERFRVEILEGTAVRRMAEVTVLIYAAADEFTDLGAPRASLELRIRQMGRAVPLGIPAEVTIAF